MFICVPKDLSVNQRVGLENLVFSTVHPAEPTSTLGQVNRTLGQVNRTLGQVNRTLGQVKQYTWASVPVRSGESTGTLGKLYGSTRRARGAERLS